jgi:hypothetical protein
VNTSENSFAVNKAMRGKSVVGGFIIIIERLRRSCRIVSGKWNHFSLPSSAAAMPLCRLMQHFVRSPVANAVAIDPAKSSTASHFAYEFDLSKLNAPEFVGSEHGKIFAALLEQTKLIMDEGVDPEINPVVMEGIFALPPDERPAKFAYELAFEGKTYRRSSGRCDS